MKTEAIYYRRKLSNGIYVYDSNKNKSIDNLLSKYNYIYIYNNEIKKDNDMTGYNSNGNMYITTERKITDKSKSLFRDIDANEDGYIIEKHHMEEEVEVDKDALIEGIYNDGVILTYKKEIKEYENFYNIAKELSISVEDLYELNPEHDSAISFLEGDINKEKIRTTKIDVPYYNRTFYIKKLNKKTRNLKQLIHTFIRLNGFDSLDLFMKLYNDELRDIRSFLKYIGYKENENIIEEWRLVSFAMKNKTDLHKKCLRGDITTTNILINYDNLYNSTEYKALTTLKEQQKFISDAKRRFIREEKSKLLEKKIINFQKKNKHLTKVQLCDALNIGNTNLSKIIKDNYLEVNTESKSKENNIENSYNWFILQGLKPSYKAIQELSSKRKTIVSEIDGEKSYEDKITKYDIGTIKKVLKSFDVYTHTEYKESLKVQESLLKSNLVDNKEVILEELDDDDFDFWSYGTDFCNELDEDKKEAEDTTEIKNKEEYEFFTSESKYKIRRRQFEKEKKDLEIYIQNEIDRKKLTIDLDEITLSWLKKMGYTQEEIIQKFRDNVESGASEENIKELKKIVEAEKVMKEVQLLNEEKKSKLDDQLDNLFENLD
jgi:hypothetical protein